ncbi:hypothetical protein [Candidatus Palauibacter sp.]|uniref:hypothetical protein n=1 Tax=Candidatus Palauibacter sp. TaxID=3101350 RepID=UPI003D0BC174
MSTRHIGFRFSLARRSASEETDDRKRRVTIRIRELRFQRLETFPQDVRLGRIERLPQTLQALSLRGREVDLHRFANLSRPP